ncbi:MAG: hypothetical protein ACKOPN_08465, partial [Prochlorococcaceae cyanobacterium]
MLRDVQQALADITASVDWCSRLRADPAALEDRYLLDARERRQVLAVVNHPSLACVCSLQRMNRLSPLVLHLPQLMQALAAELPTLMPSYWADHPFAYSHGYVECQRFCRWLGGQSAGERVRTVLQEADLALAA